MLRSDTFRSLTFALFALPALLGGGIILSQPATALVRQDDKKQDEKKLDDKKVDEKKDDTAYSLKRVYTKGDKSRYKTTMTVKSDKSELSGGAAISVVLLEKVTKVDNEGGVTLAMEFEEANAKLGDNELDMSSMMPKITRTLDAKGNTLKIDSEGGSGPLSGTDNNQTAMFINTQANYLPEKAIKVGDTWEYEFNAPGSDSKSNTPKAKGKATLIGKEMFKGIETLRIKTEAEADLPKSNPAGAGKMKMMMMNLVEIGTGRPVKIEGTISGNASQFGNATMEIKTELVTDADKKTPKDVKTKE